MNHTAPQQSHHTALIEADPDLPIIRVTRDFRATPAAVMRAHTDPDLYARWIGPATVSTTIDVWDARDGGSWRWVSRDPEGNEHAFRGCFHQVEETGLVQTFTWEGAPDQVSLERLRVEDLGEGLTRLHAQSLCESFEARNAWLDSGMESGVDEGYGNLEELLAEGVTR